MLPAAERGWEERLDSMQARLEQKVRGGSVATSASGLACVVAVFASLPWAGATPTAGPSALWQVDALQRQMDGRIAELQARRSVPECPCICVLVVSL